jgi:hypothetical protein
MEGEVMGYKAMVLIICDGCKRRMTVRHYIGAGEYDACSVECAQKIVAEKAE